MERLIERLTSGEASGACTTGQLAAELGSTREYVRKLIVAGAINGCWRVGDEWRIPLHEAARVLREAGRTVI